MKRKQWLYSLIFVLLIGLTVFTICSQSASFTREGFWEYVRAAHPAGLAAAALCTLLYILLEGLALLAICRALGEAFGTGMTCIPAQGGFSHEEMTIVYFVVNRFQISRMKDIVHDLDDRAYITISEVADVFKLNQDKLSQKVDNQPLLPRRK